MNTASIAVSAQNLCVVYGEDERLELALQGVYFNLMKGSWTSIVGANGSGKSTLAKVIAGLCEPSDGHLIKGVDTRVHIVLQNPETQILGDTVYEEINLSLRDPITTDPDRRKLIRSILDKVGLLLALDTPTSQLSGGEKQLLNIAACMAAGANLFVLDEVTSMLDNASRDRVIEVMRNLNDKGATILWCTHRSEELVFAERIILMEKGRVSYEGSARDFLYGDSSTVASPCEHWGMELPYVVQVVKQLKKRGYSLPVLPLLPQELSEAIKERCQ